jgi:hypothetical protein
MNMFIISATSLVTPDCNQVGIISTGANMMDKP